MLNGPSLILSKDLREKPEKIRLAKPILYPIIISIWFAVANSLVYSVLFIYSIGKNLQESIILLCNKTISVICSLFKRPKLKRTPSNHGRIKLFLDLDNTLIYSTFNKIGTLKNFFKINTNHLVYKRPYLDRFFESIEKYCDVFIYTAARQEYADEIINSIDKKKIIKKRYYRQDCDEHFRKDVGKLVDSNSDIIIIDDNPLNHLSLKELIIPIKKWTGESSDDALLKLARAFQNCCQGGGKFVEFILNYCYWNQV